MSIKYRKPRFWKDAEATQPADLGDTVQLITYDGDPVDTWDAIHSLGLGLKMSADGRSVILHKVEATR